MEKQQPREEFIQFLCFFSKVHRDTYAANFMNNLTKWEQMTPVFNNLFWEQSNSRTSHFSYFKHFWENEISRFAYPDLFLWIVPASMFVSF